MIKVRKSSERGSADYGWLKTFYTFSFAFYIDTKYMGFRDLRVINEDFIAPKYGFDPHSHKDMEIITYVLEGELTHSDSMGHEAKVLSDEVQVMSAGAGVTHGERNGGKEVLHLLQIWLLPDKENKSPSYSQTKVPLEQKKNKWVKVASPGKNKILVTHLSKGKELLYELDKKRFGYVYLINGKINLNGSLLSTGDGAFIEKEDSLVFKTTEPSHLLLFDLK